MSFQVRISPEAERQVRRLEAWWAANRPTSRTTFKEAFSAVVGHIFYSVDREANEVLIAAVWSRARGTDPPVP